MTTLYPPSLSPLARTVHRLRTLAGSGLRHRLSAIIVVVMHNGCAEKAVQAYNAAYDRLVQRGTERP